MKCVWSVFTFGLLSVMLATPAVWVDMDGSTIGSVIFGACCFIIDVAIYGYILYFVYTDATARGQNALMWTILAAIPCLTIWVFIAWLIMRPAKPS